MNKIKGIIKPNTLVIRTTIMGSGPKGEPGNPGPPGIDGKSLEFSWSGTKLGIRLEGELEYQYVDLIGPKGEKGEPGEQGPPGEKGEPGTGINILGNLSDPTELPSAGNTGDAYLINGNLWVWNGEGFEDVGNIQGPKGEPGISAYEFAVQHGFVGTEEEWLASLVGPEGQQGLPGEDGKDGKNLEFHWDGTRLGIRVQGSTEYEYVNLQGIKGEKGEDGTKGADGIGLQFTWNDTQLGVKREDEENYQFIELKGAKGDSGEPGQQGVPGQDGRSIEFSWNGTSLGVRLEGDLEYEYVNLKGEQGIPGKDGERGEKGEPGDSAYQVWLNQGNVGTIEDYLDSLKGEKGEPGQQGEQGTSGQDGRDIEFSWSGTKLGIRLEGELEYQYVDLIGPKGDKGEPGEKGEPGTDATVTEASIIDALGYTPVTPSQLNDKVDKVAGKQLSTEDYTTTEKNKLAGIATNATKNDTDANLKSRANHTGTQLASTISNFASTVRTTVLTGLSTATNAAINATDTILSALGKLQKQITDFKNLKGVANGLAELDSSGHVPSSQLPSYVDDVLEYASLANFPTTGETGKIYVTIDTNLSYRWSGSGYVEISPSLALGETSSTAYPGNKGKIAYDHSQSNHARTDATKVENSATNGNIKINDVETNVYTHPANHDDRYYTEIEIDTKLSDKVDNSRVLTDVPADAKFTDTITTINGKTGAIAKEDIVALGIPAQDTNTTYSEISTAEIDQGTASTLRTITGRRIGYLLSKVSDLISNAISTLTKSDVGLGNVDNLKQMPLSGGILENYREKLVTLSGTAPTINLNLGNVFTHTLTGNTTYTISNAGSQAHSFTLLITQTATARTVTFPASIKWQGGEIPDLSGASKTYILTFLTTNGGTNWLGMFGGEF